MKKEIYPVGVIAVWLGLASGLLPGIASGASRYEAVQSFIRKVVADNPKNAQLISIGMSDSGVPIEGVKIGSGPVHNMVVSTHHGNEYGSTEVAKAFADAVAKAPIANQTVYVIPVLNVSGYNVGDRYELNHDPNRDYPGPCGTEGPHVLKSTKALADFVAAEGIVASATLHTYFGGVLYPWGISAQGHDLYTPDQSLFEKLTQFAAQDSGYTVGNSNELLYAADGTFEDYAYWKHGMWSLLFEMGHTHSPNPNEIQKMVSGNVPGLRRFFENAPTQRSPLHDFTGACVSRAMRSVMGWHERTDE